MNEALYIEPTPSLTHELLHVDFLRYVTGHSDGSIVTCSDDKTAKRWSYSVENKKVEPLQLFSGHEGNVLCAIEKDSNTILTGSLDRTLKEWNLTTGKCIREFAPGCAVSSLLKTNNKLSIVWGLGDGTVEVCDAINLNPVSSFKPHLRLIYCLCELEDGSFVSGSADYTMKRWDAKGDILQNYSGFSSWIYRLTELNKDTFVSSSANGEINIWNPTQNQCLHTLKTHTRCMWIGQTFIRQICERFNRFNNSGLELRWRMPTDYKSRTPYYCNVQTSK